MDRKRRKELCAGIFCAARLTELLIPGVGGNVLEDHRLSASRDRADNACIAAHYLDVPPRAGIRHERRFKMRFRHDFVE